MNEIISEDGFKNVIEQGVALVDFNAPWCAPCRAQEPILNKLSEQFNGRASVAAMNVDDNRDTALHLGIQSIPTLILFKNGKEIQRFVGLQSENVLSTAIENLLS